jgi:hypothetical protein
MTNLTCDLCRSSVAYKADRPTGWVDVWISDKKPVASSYDAYVLEHMPSSRRSVTEVQTKAVTLCPRCRHWMAAVLPTSLLHQMK